MGSLPIKLPIKRHPAPTVARRGRMGGSMRQRGKDSWNLRVFVGWDPVAKQRSYLERTVRGTRREASTALAALVLEAERLSPGAPRQGTVGALCEEWLAHATSSLSPRTVVSTRGYLDHAILPALGHVQAARLTAADLDRSTAGSLRSVDQRAPMPRRPSSESTESSDGRSARGSGGGGSHTIPRSTHPRPGCPIESCDRQHPKRSSRSSQPLNPGTRHSPPTSCLRRRLVHVAAS